MIDFTPVKNARLGPEDFRKLCGVTRVTCSNWLNGHAQPHHLLTDKVAKVVDDVRLAVEAGLLPVPFNVVRRERALYIQSALAGLKTRNTAAD